MNGHDIAERTRLLSHMRYAEAVECDDTLVQQARDIIAQNIAMGGGTAGEQLWSLILRRPWNEIRKRMLDDGHEGRLLRSNSPFSKLIGIRDPEERTRLWRQARHELLALTTSSEQSAA